jgi:hypothetical protein
MALTTFANFQPPPTQVEQHVNHHLARTVIGNLAAAIALHQRDAEIAQQVLGSAGLTEGEYRRVLAAPQFVGGRVAARGGEVDHRLPGLLVVDAPEITNQQRGLHSAAQRRVALTRAPTTLSLVLHRSLPATQGAAHRRS